MTGHLKVPVCQSAFSNFLPWWTRYYIVILNLGVSQWIFAMFFSRARLWKASYCPWYFYVLSAVYLNILAHIVNIKNQYKMDLLCNRPNKFLSLCYDSKCWCTRFSGVILGLFLSRKYCPGKDFEFSNIWVHEKMDNQRMSSLIMDFLFTMWRFFRHAKLKAQKESIWRAYIHASSYTKFNCSPPSLNHCW